jgi:glycosyltransferase involved in cell wall biosynthesis
VAREVIEHYGWNRDATVVYHGTDRLQFRPPHDETERHCAREEYGLQRDAWVWLWAGEAAKGLFHVIPQLQHFPRAHLLVVSRSDVSELRQFASRLGVGAQITFHRPVDDLAEAYRASDVFVYPSVYDPFGLVVSEAMATGLPVIVGSEIGAAEWITHQENGLLCDPANPASLHQQLRWLESDPKRSVTLGSAARRTVTEHSWDRCADATLSVYERVVSARG